MAENNNYFSWHTSLAMVFIVAIISISYVYLHSDMFNNFSQAFRAKEFIDTAIKNTITGISTKPKLVVLTAMVDVNIEKKSSKQYFFNLGTSTIDLKILDNKIQYIIPTASITPDIFKWDSKHNEIIIDTPTPILDRDIVEVQSDPVKIKIRKDLGWFRFDDFYGEKLLLSAKKDMRKAVLKAGENELLQYKATGEARKIIKKLFLDKMYKILPKNNKVIIVD